MKRNKKTSSSLLSKIIIFLYLVFLISCSNIQNDLEQIKNDNSLSNKEAILQISNKLSEHFFPNSDITINIKEKAKSMFLSEITILFENTKTDKPTLWETKDTMAASIAKEIIHLLRLGSARNLDEITILIKQSVVTPSITLKKLLPPTKTIDLIKIRTHINDLNKISGWKDIPFNDNQLGPKDFEKFALLMKNWSKEIDNFEKLFIDKR